MNTRIPRALRLLALHGVNALKATVENGRYFGPMISRRKAAMLRKRALIDGTFGSFSIEQGGGWDPAWDLPRKIYPLKPYKGHLRERKRPERAAKITNALKGMPDRIKKLEEEIRDRKPKKDIAYMFRRIESMVEKNKREGPRD